MSNVSRKQWKSSYNGCNFNFHLPHQYHSFLLPPPPTLFLFILLRFSYSSYFFSLCFFFHSLFPLFSHFHSLLFLLFLLSYFFFISFLVFRFYYCLLLTLILWDRSSSLGRATRSKSSSFDISSKNSERVNKLTTFTWRWNICMNGYTDLNIKSCRQRFKSRPKYNFFSLIFLLDISHDFLLCEVVSPQAKYPSLCRTVRDCLFSTVKPH